jgi:phosphoglycolate phosphatase
VAGGDSFTEMKPSPQPLLALMADIGVAASRTVMVGDSVYDIECAHAAGVDACAVSYGFQPVETLKALDPEYLVSAFDMIKDIVDGTIDRGQSKM